METQLALEQVQLAQAALPDHLLLDLLAEEMAEQVQMNKSRQLLPQ
jgi:hypothetical protein